MVGSSLEVAMEKITTLASLNCCNFVSRSKRLVHTGIGTMDGFMTLKDHSDFKFIHGSRFPKVVKGQSVCFQDVCRYSKH
jgi:hypothetical protein